MPDPVTDGLKKTLGQYRKTVTVADAKSAVEGHNETTVDVTIVKIKGRQFADVFDQIDVLVQKGVVRITDDAGKLLLGSNGFLTDFRPESILLRGGQPVLNIIAIVSGLPQTHVDNLDLLDLAKLLGAGWEVNEHFFVQNQTEFKEALGPIWDLVESLFAVAKAAKKKTEATTEQPESSPSESSPDSSTNSSAEDTETSTE